MYLGKQVLLSTSPSNSQPEKQKQGNKNKFIMLFQDKGGWPNELSVNLMLIGYKHLHWSIVEKIINMWGQIQRLRSAYVESCRILILNSTVLERKLYFVVLSVSMYTNVQMHVCLLDHCSYRTQFQTLDKTKTLFALLTI